MVITLRVIGLRLSSFIDFHIVGTVTHWPKLFRSKYMQYQYDQGYKISVEEYYCKKHKIQMISNKSQEHLSKSTANFLVWKAIFMKVFFPIYIMLGHSSYYDCNTELSQQTRDLPGISPNTSPGDVPLETSLGCPKDIPSKGSGGCPQEMIPGMSPGYPIIGVQEMSHRRYPHDIPGISPGDIPQCHL